MEEPAVFEARAVLAPRRTRLARLALLLPALALVATAWAGLGGARSHEATADPDPAAVAVQSPADEGAASAVPQGSLRPQFPEQVVGLDVQRLDDAQGRRFGRDEAIAVSGWYVATALTNCPPLAAIYREGSLPEVRGDADELAFCDRSGVLYASRPDLDQRVPRNNLEDNRSKNAGLPAIAATLVIGIIAPLELEMIGTTATPVVFVGRFIEPGGGCRVRAGCRRELVVDHVAWTPGV